MFDEKRWTISCETCATKMDLGSDRVLNLIDHGGSIITKGLQALDELIDFSTTLSLRFPRLESIRTFINEHHDHVLHLGPLMTGEYESYTTISKEMTIKAMQVELGCESCHQSCALQPVWHQQQIINKKEVSIRDLELLNQLFELYNEMGACIGMHLQMIELEQTLPFLKRHAGHKIWMQSH